MGIVGHNPLVAPVWALALLLAVACGTREPASPPDQVTGLITAIGRGDDGAIESFTVRGGDQSFQIRIDPGRDYGFNLEHLAAHRASEWPVRVRLEQRDGTLYAVDIVDA
jgi:hypothetical protein